MHMAIGAVVNAAVGPGRPSAPASRCGSCSAEMTPEELVELVDFRYLTDALTPDEALEHPRAAAGPGRRERDDAAARRGYPAYTTSPGWLGYSDEKLAPPVPSEAVADGFTQIKLKVGADLDDDVRRLRHRPRGGRPGHPHRRSTPTSAGTSTRPIDWMQRARASSTRTGSRSRPAPTTSSATPRSRRAVAPITVATGEHVQNRVVFKQLLQAGAIDVLQIDAARVGGVNENIAILLLAAKFGVPVCPHAGGVGLCELVQHLSMFDYVAVSGTHEDRVDRVRRPPARALRDPAQIENGRYVAPNAPGTGAEMIAASIEKYRHAPERHWTNARLGLGGAGLGNHRVALDDADAALDR